MIDIKGLINKIIYLIVVNACLWNTCIITKGYSYIEVNVNEANYNPIPVIMLDFVSDKESKAFSQIIGDKIINDLNKSGTFSIFKEKVNSIDKKTNLLKINSLISNYIDYNALIAGHIFYENYTYKIVYVLWDIHNNKLLLAKSFEFSELDATLTNFLAHHISNSIYKSFIGEDGFFNSKIAFAYGKQIYIMDYDGDNIKSLIQTDSKVFTPVFSKNNKYLAYIVLNNGVSEIYIYDFTKNKSSKLGNFKNLVLAPRFSPDSKFMLFAVAKQGSTNIFKLNLLTKELTQLTHSYSINIPGDFSPDNSKIVFTSDRYGGTHIYTMSSDGNNVKKISQGSGGYSTPTWSPRGDLIAFTRIAKGGIFSIGVMDEYGNREKLVAENYFVEGPCWSSNGRNLIYQYVYDNEYKKFNICLINLANGFKIKLNPFENIKDPCLSSNFINSEVINKEKNLI